MARPDRGVYNQTLETGSPPWQTAARIASRGEDDITRERTMKAFSRLALLSMAALLSLSGGAKAQLIISGNDEKQGWDANGKPVTNPPGHDTVSIIDIADRTHPKIVANLPLMNTVVGPPTNLAITPDQHLALVANSLDWVKEGDSWKGTPDNKVYVIDLTQSPPVQIATIETGKQPSGMAINRAGNLALVANRADNSVSVLSINGKEVKLVDTVSGRQRQGAAWRSPRQRSRGRAHRALEPGRATGAGLPAFR